ncbi:MAG: hypothetical protein HQL31_10785 [Planctomycetes bacterium]|nr:hypothetical protein [Planctomycetota bacterium]
MTARNKSFYEKKWGRLDGEPWLQELEIEDRAWMRDVFVLHGLRFQQTLKMAEAARLLRAWGENPISSWEKGEDEANFFQFFLESWNSVLAELPDYSRRPVLSFPKREDYSVVSRSRPGAILKTCPTYSDDYGCCGLKVVNSIENCSTHCTYCILHAFYEEREIRFTSDLAQKLAETDPGPGRHRLSTGEYSDSLLLGDYGGGLSALLDYARSRPNVCMEFKTKLSNIDWLLEHRDAIPANVVVSWSLNSPGVAHHEEGSAPPPAERLHAARRLADRGVLVGFHIHPMLIYRDYARDYAALACEVAGMFSASEVAWLSQGSLNMIRKQREIILRKFPRSQLLRGEFVSKDEGKKIVYPEEKRVALYSVMNEGLQGWKGEVFRYLCMEPMEVYQRVLGHAYSGNDSLFEAMNDSVFSKIEARR